MIYIKTDKEIGEFLDNSKIDNVIRTIRTLKELETYTEDEDYEIINGSFLTNIEIFDYNKIIMKSIFSNELENCIVFNCTGALDFSERIAIELSLEEKEGFTKIHPPI